MPADYDLIIVGSGAGGGAVAWQAVHAGLNVLMLEKGNRLPRDRSTLNVNTVFKEGRFKNKEPWRDGHGGTFVPDEYYNVGGKTKWYGAALLRFSQHEFEPDPAYRCLGFPFGYAELEPWYDQAEQLLHVNLFENEPELQQLIDKVVSQGSGWRCEPLPLGLKPEILNDEEEAKHFDGYASPCGYKGDSENNLIDKLADRPNFTLLVKKKVTGLLHDPATPDKIEGVVCLDGSWYRAKAVVLAAGAMTTPRIMQDHLAHTGLGPRLPSASLIGANFKLHINSALVGFSPFKATDVLRKTAIFMNEAYPHSTVQCLGWMDGDLLATQLPAAVPKFGTGALGARANGFFVTTEDSSAADNRIISGMGAEPTADYSLDRIPEAKAEHEAIIRDFTRRLLTAGIAGVDRYVGLAGTAHALGTMVTGNDPKASVVDPFGNVHGMDGVYVADGSVLPRSSRVNPALTIYAFGLRLGDHLGRVLA